MMAMPYEPTPQAMPSPISRKSAVPSRGSSIGVRNFTMLAAPATPNARGSESPIIAIVRAPATQSST